MSFLFSVEFIGKLNTLVNSSFFELKNWIGPDVTQILWKAQNAFTWTPSIEQWLIINSCGEQGWFSPSQQKKKKNIISNIFEACANTCSHFLGEYLAIFHLKWATSFTKQRKLKLWCVKNSWSSNECVRGRKKVNVHSCYSSRLVTWQDFIVWKLFQLVLMVKVLAELDISD